MQEWLPDTPHTIFATHERGSASLIFLFHPRLRPSSPLRRLLSPPPCDSQRIWVLLTPPPSTPKFLSNPSKNKKQSNTAATTARTHPPPKKKNIVAMTDTLPASPRQQQATPPPPLPSGGGSGEWTESVTIEQLAVPLVRYSDVLVPLDSAASAAAAQRAACPPRAAGESSPRKRDAAELGLSRPMSPSAMIDTALSRTLVPYERHEAERSKEVLQADQVLDLLFPPAPAPDAPGMGYRVSTQPASGLDVIALQEQQEVRLRLRSARLEGVCTQRRDVYSQCFAEVIRQVAVECPERGLLLSRVRDEIDATVDAYKSLADTASSLSMRKVIQRTLQHETQKELSVLEYEVQIQAKRVQALAAKLDKTKKIIHDKHAMLEAHHEEEVRFIKKGNIQLNNELKRLSQASA